MLKKVLIVDDSRAESRMMQTQLESAGFWAVVLNDPALLEQTIDMEHPELILLDVVMPGRNGYQACRDLKANDNYRNLPIVIVTSKSGESDKFWGRQQGAEGYLTKPFTAEQLISEVHRVLGP